jgi:hypothetical protein
MLSGLTARPGHLMEGREKTSAASQTEPNRSDPIENNVPSNSVSVSSRGYTRRKSFIFNSYSTSAGVDSTKPSDAKEVERGKSSSAGSAG